MVGRKPIENVLYFLGAGFSAPLGLPVTSNFLAMARDQFAVDPEKYKDFQRIFAEIRQLAQIKNFFQCDLNNIEEILSLLEMAAFLGDAARLKEFTKFLEDVIEFYTPSPTWTAPGPGAGGPAYAFGADRSTNEYARFVAGLFNLIVNPTVKPSISGQTEVSACYAVVTTNYDRVLETFALYLMQNAGQVQNVDCKFTTTSSIGFTNIHGPVLSKLHGGVGEGNIVPPTWSKGSHPAIKAQWQLACSLVANANHIRIVGYALSPVDTYVRYLLKLAMTASTNLKSIDVLCLDPDGSVARNCEALVDARYFRNYRFVSDNVGNYLRYLNNEAHNGSQNIQSRALEITHRQFFGHGVGVP